MQLDGLNSTLSPVVKGVLIRIYICNTIKPMLLQISETLSQNTHVAVCRTILECVTTNGVSV